MSGERTDVQRDNVSKTAVIAFLREVLEKGIIYELTYDGEVITIERKGKKEARGFVYEVIRKQNEKRNMREREKRNAKKQPTTTQQVKQPAQQEEQQKQKTEEDFSEREIMLYKSYRNSPNNPYRYVGQALGWE